MQLLALGNTSILVWNPIKIKEHNLSVLVFRDKSINNF